MVSFLSFFSAVQHAGVFASLCILSPRPCLSLGDGTGVLSPHILRQLFPSPPHGGPQQLRVAVLSDKTRHLRDRRRQCHKIYSHDLSRFLMVICRGFAKIVVKQHILQRHFGLQIFVIVVSFLEAYILSKVPNIRHMIYSHGLIE